MHLRQAQSGGAGESRTFPSMADLPPAPARTASYKPAPSADLVSTASPETDAKRPRFWVSHPTGIVDVGAEYSDNGHAKSANVIGTGRKLMKGVWW